jgi:hypothetical protein
MRRASTLLVSLAIAASTIGVSIQSAAAYDAHVWSNSDAFTATCLGFLDTYPKQHYALAVSQYAKLGFSPVAGALGPGFTRSAFLSTVFYDYAVYVHSHGDNYWASSGAPNVDSGFLQDPGSGKCNSNTRDMVRSSAIRAATAGTTYNVVIMSTCMLGSKSSTMPGAFQIAKVKTATDREFYLGYVYHVWDSASLRFEKAFWGYMNGGAIHTRWLADAYTYASSIGGYEAVSSSEPFQANWWGNPKFDGSPYLPTAGCPTCPS